MKKYLLLLCMLIFGQAQAGVITQEFISTNVFNQNSSFGFNLYSGTDNLISVELKWVSTLDRVLSVSNCANFQDCAPGDHSFTLRGLGGTFGTTEYDTDSVSGVFNNNDNAVQTYNLQSGLLGSIFLNVADFIGTGATGELNLSSSWETFVDTVSTTSNDALVSLVYTTEANAVPEPISLALFSLGLAGVGFSRKKRKT